MHTFQTNYTVPATLERVAGFHSGTDALKKLTPPPVLVQLRRIEPLAEGSVSEFTLWFGPLPVRWTAVHSNVNIHGFTDTQERGPMKYWQHTHRFDITAENSTRVTETIQYEYKPGWRGWLGRALFSPLLLRFMFSYRARALRKMAK